MEFSDQIKRYLWALCSLIIIVYFIYEQSTSVFSCDKWAAEIKNSKEFALVLKKKENHESRDVYFYGVDLNDGTPTEYVDGSGWLSENFNKFLTGDTIIKKRGKYAILIKRKGTKILIPFICNQKVYNDK